MIDIFSWLSLSRRIQHIIKVDDILIRFLDVSFKTFRIAIMKPFHRLDRLLTKMHSNLNLLFDASRAVSIVSYALNILVAMENLLRYPVSDVS